MRVRSKSTAVLMPSGVAAPTAQEAGNEAAGEGAKGLLRGLFRR
ncbi:MAG: hypothetical protein ACTHZI_03400 [Luteimonas sp.]